MWEALASGAAAFISTNIDDLFVLMLLFAQAKGRAGKGRVAGGQSLGIAALTAASLLCAYHLARVPHYYIRCLGLVPIFLGICAWRKRNDPEEPAVKGPGVLAVAMLAIANGGDNLGVYIPLFTRFSGGQRTVCVLVFAALTGLWCLLGSRLAALPGVQAVLRRWKGILVPLVLIALGVSILLLL